jgi:hypothetical protein
MGCTPHRAVPWLLASILLASARLNAQAHGPPATEFLDEPEEDTPSTLAATLADMDTWLREMTGRFRLSSALNSERPGVLVDCVGVGDGPGVQCMTGRGGNTPPGEQANASMQLFGLDPLALTISRLAVNGRGIAQHAQGKVRGDTLVFRGINCAIPENIRSGMRIISCEERLKIRALPDELLLQFTTQLIVRYIGGTEVNTSSTMWMKRVPQVEAELSLRRVAPGQSADLNSRLSEVNAEEPAEEIARAAEDAREEREALALDVPVTTPVTQAPANQLAALDTLDEAVVEGEFERRRQAQLPIRVANPDIVTVTRNSSTTGNGSIRVRLQPYSSQREIRLRASNARKLADGASSRLELQRDRLTTNDGSKIRSVTLEFTAGMDEADGLPVLIPFNATTSLFNIDYVRFDSSTHPLMTTLRNVMEPETRRCTSELGFAGGEDDFHDRFVLLGDTYGDCNRTVKSREGDLLFADSVPQRLRQELRDLYDPVYNQFARNLGSEPGIVFVVWRPESSRSDFRLVPTLNRTSLLVFNGPSWEHGLTEQQREALWEDVAQEQIERRISGGDVITDAAADYLLNLARAEGQQTTSRWLTAEVPEWIAACGRAMSLRAGATSAPRGIYSYACGLVVQFVYDAVARAKSNGEDSVMRTWRTLLGDAYRRKQNGVSSSAFLDSSADARRSVQGLLSGAVDWAAFAVELGKVGVQLRVTPGPIAPSVQVQSLSNFRD